MRRGLVAAALAVGALASLPAVLSDVRTVQLAAAGAYLVAILGLDLLVRQSGRLSLGHGAFMGLGGQTTALLAAHQGVPPFAAIAVGALVAAAAGTVTAVPALRLPGAYLALPTLGLAIALPWLTAKVGRQALPHPPSPLAAYAVSWTLAAVLLAVAVRIAASPFARALRALRDNEPAAQAAGVARSLHVLAVAALSAGYAGVAGSLVALQAGGVRPGLYPVALSLLLLAAAAVGGLGSLRAALLGAFALEYVPRLVRLEHPGRGAWTFAFGAALVALVLLSPLAAAFAEARARRGR